MDVIGVVSLCHPQWKSPVSLNNTESQGLGFLTRDWDDGWDGALLNASGFSGPFHLLGGVRL